MSVPLQSAEARIAAWRAELTAAGDRGRNAVFHYEIGNALERAEDEDGAIEHYEAARRAEPAFRPPLFALIRLLERFRAGAPLAELYTAEARAARTPREKASALLEQASLLEDQMGEERQARALFERALGADPTYDAPALMLELACRRTGDKKGAARATAARAELSDHPITKRLLQLEAALDLDEAGDAEGAVQALRRGSSDPRERLRYLSHLARIARRAGRGPVLLDALESMAALAEEYARSAGAADPGLSAGALPPFADEKSAAAAACVLLWDAARQRLRSGGEPAAALALLDRALALRPDDLLLRSERLELLDRTGEIALAEQEAKALLARAGDGPHLAVLHLRLADLGRRAGDGRRSREALLRAVEVDPSSDVATALLGEPLAGDGAVDRRIAWLEEQASRSVGEVRARRLWEAAQLTADQLKNFGRARPLYLGAAAAAPDPVPILRELHGAALRLDESGEADAAERLLAHKLDPDERAALLHARYRKLADTEPGAADELLRSLLAEKTPLSWVPDATRLRAAARKDAPSLAEAHRVLSSRTTDPPTALAHRIAAARALARGGALSDAAAELRDVLKADPGHRYALALLEEVLRREGAVADVALLLRAAAETETNDRAAEVLLLRAGQAAEEVDSIEVAAQAYRQAGARRPRSVAAPWALYRLALSAKDADLRNEALATLAQREAEAGRPGRGALLLGEYLDLVAANAARATRELRAALPDEFVGLAAAAALLLSPHAVAYQSEALERMLRDAHGGAGIALRRLLAGVLLARGDAPDKVRDLVSRTLEVRSDDRWACFAVLRLQSGDPAARAAALEGLAAATGDGDTAAELLLAALFERLIEGSDADAPRRLGDEIAEVAPNSLAAAVARLEAGGRLDPEARVRALERRLAHARDATAASIEAELARALVAAGRAQDALPKLRRICERDPGDLAAWEALLHAARDADARDDRARAGEKLAAGCTGPARARLLCEAAAWAQESGDAARGETLLREALQADPSSDDAYHRLNEILDARGDDRALLTLVDSRVAETDDPEALAGLFYEQALLRGSLGALEPAVEALKNVELLDPENAHALALLAKTYLDLDHPQDAVDALRRLGDRELPMEARRLARTAAARILHEKLADPAAAYAELVHLEKAGLADEPLLTRMARLAEEAKLYNEARGALLRAAALVEGPARARLERRVAALSGGPLGDRAGAISAYRRALDAVPADVAAAEGLAELLDRGSRRKMGERLAEAILERLARDPGDPDGLRDLRHAAAICDDRDRELIVLTALDALGLATEREVTALEALRQAAPVEPAAALGEDGLAVLGAPPAGSALLELLRVAGPAAGPKPADLGVGRREHVKPKQPSVARDAVGAVASAFGVKVEDVYVGGNEASRLSALPGEDGPIWVIGSEVGADGALEPVERFEAGRLALAARLSALAIADREPADAIALLHALARAGDASLPGAAPSEIEPLAAEIRRDASRTARRSIAPIAARVDEAPEEFCAAVRRACLRAGLVVSGDLWAALATAIGDQPSRDAVARSPEARALLRFWLSPELAALRRDLGLDHDAARSDGGAPRDSDPAAGRLERTSTFFADQGGPGDWTVSVDDVVARLEPAGEPSRLSAPPAPAARTHRARTAFLVELARTATGQARAGLLLSAAELSEASGDLAPARALVAEARAAGGTNPALLRRVRQDAVRRRAWAEAVELLEAEVAAPLGADERALDLLLAAALKLGPLGDLADAEDAASRALELRPASAAAGILLATIQLARERPDEACATLERAARAWKDPRGAAALLVEAGRLNERTGDVTRARFLFRRAAELDRDLLEAALGLARSARAQGGFDEAVVAAVHAAHLIGDRKIGDALLRAAARAAHLGAGRPALAASVLGDATEFPALEALAEAADDAGDAAAHERALSGCAKASRRTDRALALLWLAPARAARGDLDGAREALREAAHADQKLSTVLAVRDRLARASSDPLEMARALIAAGDGALAGSARAALVDGAAALERRLLSEAVAEAAAKGTPPAEGASDISSLVGAFGAAHAYCAATLYLDAAADAGDDAEVRAALRTVLARAPASLQGGPTLLLADLVHRGGPPGERANVLRELRRAAPGDAAALRALARMASAERAAELWREEAARASSPARAAFAFTMAGRLALPNEEAAADAFLAALGKAPDAMAASWALAELARGLRDPARRCELLARAAEHVGDPREAARLLVRAALSGPEPDPALLARASAASPDDRALSDLCLRLVPGLSPEARARLLELVAEGAPFAWARAMHLRAAATLEEASDFGAAGDACRAALGGDQAEDAFAHHLLDRIDPGAGDPGQCEDRLRAKASGASDHLSRALALEALAAFLIHERKEPERAIHPLTQLLELFPGHIPSLRAQERIAMDRTDDARLAAVERELAATTSPRDAGAHARLAVRLLLRQAGAKADAADELVRQTFDYAEADLWLLRRVEAAARAGKDARLLARLLTDAAEHFETPLERVAMEARAAEADSEARSAAVAANRLERAARGAGYPVADEIIGELREQAGAAAKAAEAYEAAAKSAKAPRRIARLLLRAAAIYQDEVMDAGRAAKTLLAAAAADVSLPDVLVRLKKLPAEHRDDKKLAEIVQARVKLGGETNEMIDLHLLHAELSKSTGNAEGVKQSLRAAITCAPDRIDLLEQLYRVCKAAGDWRGASQALKKTAEVVSDPAVLRNVYLLLSDVYGEMRDMRRAREAAMKVLELFPEDRAARARVAALEQRPR